jgi:hypothetical protein
MKYNTVKIIASGTGWRVETSTSDFEREEVKTIPNAMGFYHYPETMSLAEAFKELKSTMYGRHLLTIESLKASANELDELTI